ncbi:hypothetical protein, partial [Candidatus Tokpelaia sp.]|uniref:hypothetical protein n=1 Tax=Candidatus Tokpelaia sp. TaxID=2233777 RepID=UPI001AEEAE2D
MAKENKNSEIEKICRFLTFFAFSILTNCLSVPYNGFHWGGGILSCFFGAGFITLPLLTVHMSEGSLTVWIEVRKRNVDGIVLGYF